MYEDIVAPSYWWLAQDYSNSSDDALELLQSCTKPFICDHHQHRHH